MRCQFIESRNPRNLTDGAAKRGNSVFISLTAADSFAGPASAGPGRQPSWLVAFGLGGFVRGGFDSLRALLAIVLAAFETVFEGGFVVILGMADAKLRQAILIGSVAVRGFAGGLEAGAVFRLFVLEIAAGFNVVFFFHVTRTHPHHFAGFVDAFRAIACERSTSGIGLRGVGKRDHHAAALA